MQKLNSRCSCEGIAYEISGELGPITDDLPQHDTWPGSHAKHHETR